MIPKREPFCLGELRNPAGHRTAAPSRGDQQEAAVVCLLSVCHLLSHDGEPPIRQRAESYRMVNWQGVTNQGRPRRWTGRCLERLRDKKMVARELKSATRAPGDEGGKW